MRKVQTSTHPCFDKSAACSVARIHLPVAPNCNIKCSYCSRKMDCINESRPGVTSVVLNPVQAAKYLQRAAEHMPVGVAGIAGPGDSLADPERTFAAIRECRKVMPELLFCLSTNGLALPDNIDRLVDSGVSHVTVTMNTMDPYVGADIYEWVRYKKRNYRGLDAAKLLLDNQLESLMLLKERDIAVKVNTLLIPGVNESQIVPVSRYAAGCGCEIMNIIPLIPVEGTIFETVPQPSCTEVEKYRAEAEKNIEQSRHCQRCRSDAAGILGKENSREIQDLLAEAADSATVFTEKRDKVAFVSREGLLVNMHLGEATDIYVYEKIGEEIQLSEIRKAPDSGQGDRRWHQLAEILSDCACLLTGGAGARPVTILESSGLSMMTIDGIAEDAVSRLYRGEGVSFLKKRNACGSGRCGSGDGCG